MPNGGHGQFSLDALAGRSPRGSPSLDHSSDEDCVRLAKELYRIKKNQPQRTQRLNKSLQQEKLWGIFTDLSTQVREHITSYL